MLIEIQKTNAPTVVERFRAYLGRREKERERAARERSEQTLSRSCDPVGNGNHAICRNVALRMAVVESCRACQLSGPFSMSSDTQD